MNKLTISIPIVKYGEEERAFFKNCIEGVARQKNKNFSLSIVTYEDLSEKIENDIDNKSLGLVPIFDYLPENFKLIEMNYAEVVNAISKVITTDYFSIIQFDDVILDSYVSNFYAHSESYNASVFLPIVLNHNGVDFTQTTNEIVWNVNFGSKLGHLDLESVQKYPTVFSFVGAIYKTEEFKSLNGFKLNIKRYFELEFILRVLHKGLNVFVIPKFSVKHTVNRTNSIEEYFNSKYNTADNTFWYNTIKKEFYFLDKDREITAPNAV